MAESSNNDQPAQEPSSRETRAIGWQDSDYREWVQSQIASRMLLRLGGITVVTLLAIATAAYTFINSVRTEITASLLKDVTQIVEPTIERQLDLRLGGAVASALLDQSKLVDEAVEQAETELNERIPDLVQQERFIDPAAKAISKVIQDRGASQRIILDEARSSIFDRQGAEATRALGLRLYVLFHPSVRSKQVIDPLRKTIATLLSFGPEGDLPPPGLIDSALQHYPMGLVPQREPDISDCGVQNSSCEHWDSSVLEFVLSYATDGRISALDPASLRGFFQRLPPQLAERALDWVREYPSSRLAEILLGALVSAHDEDTLIVAVDALSSMLALEGDQDLSGRAGVALAALDPDARLPRATRDLVLERVWATFTPDELERAFSGEALRRQREAGAALIGNDDLASASSDSLFGFGSLFGSIPSRVEGDPEGLQLGNRRRIVLSLLRPGDGPLYAGGVDEWNITFQSTIGRSVGRPALIAMAMRLHRDAEAGRNVQAVADRLLVAAQPKELTAEDVLAVAMQHASDTLFETMTRDYRKYWSETGGTRTATDVSRVVVERWGAVDPDLAWLKEQFDTVDTPKETFEDHLFDTIAATNGEPAKEGETPPPPLERALRAMHSAGDPAEPRSAALRSILLQRLVALSGDDYWGAAAIAENSGALVAPDPPDGIEEDPAIATLRQEYDWVGTRLPETVPLVALASGRSWTHRFADAMPDEGLWFRLRVPAPRRVRLRGTVNGEFVVFDVARRQVLARTYAVDAGLDTGFPLNGGEFALHWRRATAFSGDLSIGLGEDLVPNTRDTVRAVDPDRYVFDAGSFGGQAWLAVDLAANQLLTIETSAIGQSDDDTLATNTTDTVIDLFAAGPDAEPLSDDDGGVGNFSRLQFRSERQATYFARIRHFGDDDFEPDTTFQVIVTVED